MMGVVSGPGIVMSPRMQKPGRRSSGEVRQALRLGVSGGTKVTSSPMTVTGFVTRRFSA